MAIMQAFHVSSCLAAPRLRRPLAGMAIAALLAVAGCGGSDLSQVTGRVTLDGQPLPNAFVEFVPTGSEGSTSSGRTNDRGEYMLMFSRDVPGASLGPHRVQITTQDVYVDDEGYEALHPERVPERYNEASELTAEVLPGSNQFDFELESDNPG